MDEPQVLASGDCSSNIALPVYHDIPSQIQHRDQSRSRSRSTLSGADTAGERCSVPDSTRAAPIADDPNPPTYPRKGSIEQREAVFTIPLASRVRTCESSLIAGGLRVCSSRRAARGRLAVVVGVVVVRGVEAGLRRIDEWQSENGMGA
jgi:hypothetical protein